MASNYPGGMDEFETIATDTQMSTTVGGRTHRDMHNDLGDAVESIEGELGLNPAGIYDTVAERLAAVDDRVLDGTISDIDIAAEADIARSKIAGTALTTGGTGIFNVKDYGAAGDDSTDDTEAIQAAINAAVAVGGTVLVPPGTYKITDALAVVGAVTITGTGTIHQVTSGKNGLTITGDDVIINGITLTGRHTSATYASNESAIAANGASASAPLQRIVIRNTSIAGWGMYGIFVKWVTQFVVQGCKVTIQGHCGIGGLSAIDGLVADNMVDDVVPHPSGDAYGISVSREETDSLTTDPPSSDIVISGNRISGIPAWEGLDTHGGQRIVFSDNVVTGCHVGIAVLGTDDASNHTVWPPVDVTITGNVIDSQVTDGSASTGISFTGAFYSSLHATGGVIAGNTIRGHGSQANNLDGAIYTHWTKGLVICDNTFVEPSPYAIHLYHDNLGFVVSGNTIVDAWTTDADVVAVIGMRDGNNSGLISGNTLRAGTKTATIVNKYGIYCPSGATGIVVNYGLNDFGAASDGEVANGTTERFSANHKRDVTTTMQFLAAGGESAPGYSFTDDQNTGFYSLAADQIGVTIAGSRIIRFLSNRLWLEEGTDIVCQTTTGSMIGTGSTQKIGFWGATPVTQPVANADTSGASLGDLETEINQLKALLRTIGLMAS